MIDVSRMGQILVAVIGNVPAEDFCRDEEELIFFERTVGEVKFLKERGIAIAIPYDYV